MCSGPKPLPSFTFNKSPPARITVFTSFSRPSFAASSTLIPFAATRAASTFLRSSAAAAAAIFFASPLSQVASSFCAASSSAFSAFARS